MNYSIKSLIAKVCAQEEKVSARNELAFGDGDGFLGWKASTTRNKRSGFEFFGEERDSDVCGCPAEDAALSGIDVVQRRG